MLFTSVLWPAVLLPLLVAGTVVWLDPSLRTATPVDEERLRSPWGGAVAFAGAYFAAHAAVAGWPPLPAVESSDWLAWLVVGAALGGIVVHTGRLRLADPILAALIFFGLSATTLRPMLVHTWTRAEGAVALGVLAFALTVTWMTTIRWTAVHESAVRRSPEVRALRPAKALVSLTVLGLTAIALGLSATARLGMIAGAAAIALLALAAVTASTRGSVLPGMAAAPPLVTALVGLIANGLLYADLHPAGAAALIAAPLFGLVGFRALSEPAWRRTAVAVLVTALVAGVAVGIAGWQTAERQSDPAAYDPYA